MLASTYQSYMGTDLTITIEGPQTVNVGSYLGLQVVIGRDVNGNCSNPSG